MGTTLLQAGGDSESTANTDEYWSLVGGNNQRVTETEANIKVRAAGTLKNLYCRLFINSVAATSTFTLRKNSADATQVLSIGSSATGEFEDTTHTDASAAGDLWCVKSHPGAATGTFAPRIVSALFDATTDTVSVFCNSGSNTRTTASTSFFFPLTGWVDQPLIPTEANCKVRMREAGSFKNLGIYVVSARATASTVKMRKNGADGTLTMSLTGTGWVEDTTHTDTVTAGEDWNYDVVLGTGSDTLNWQKLKVEFTSTAGDGILVCSEPGTGVAVTDATN